MDDEFGDDDRDRVDKMIHEVEDQSFRRPGIFESMSQAAKKPLYLGCTLQKKLVIEAPDWGKLPLKPLFSIT